MRERLNLPLLAPRSIEDHATRFTHLQDSAELALKAARHFARLADQYVLGNGRFTVALAGGSTPKAMYSLLARAPFLDTVPWQSVFFFFGDERTVPPEHAESNFRMASESLLSKVPVPPDNVFRIAGEEADPHRAAALYETQLTSFFSPGVPRLDLVLLGLGTDGHTASLFPHSEALKSTDHYAVANFVEKFQGYRITLTAKTINLACNVTFLVSGNDKAESITSRNRRYFHAERASSPDDSTR